jgi:REP element-mobilizing transposase RayT
MVSDAHPTEWPRPQVAGLTERDLSKVQPVIIICIMSKIVGYMLTWTTYGSWLPGDKRGYVEHGQILPGKEQILERNKDRQRLPAVILNEREEKIVQEVIFTEAQRISQILEALIVYSNHVHLLARPHTESMEQIVSRYKSKTTRALWRNGRQGRIWTKGYDKRFCFTEEEVTQRIRYINQHNPD